MLKSRQGTRGNISTWAVMWTLTSLGPSIRGALVLGYEGWLVGYQMYFETSKSRVTQSNFAVGYKTDEFQLHTNVNDGTEFGGSITRR